MHYHLEVIIPPTDNVESVLGKVLSSFDEDGTDEDGDRNRNTFWDFWLIGGRLSGTKISQSLDQDKLESFHKALNDNNITVSGVTCGKQELKPASQIPFVNNLWREFFPDQGEVCPLFNHYNDQYKHAHGYPDIMTLGHISKNLSADHVIIADTEGEATYMIQDSMWNGVSYVDSKWDGKVKSAVDLWKNKIENYVDDYKKKNTPTDDWLCITVDYHS